MLPAFLLHGIALSLTRISTDPIKKGPVAIATGPYLIKSGDVLLSHGRTALSSALTGFTSEFEMGSGGAQSLLSPENWSQPKAV